MTFRPTAAWYDARLAQISRRVARYPHATGGYEIRSRVHLLAGRAREGWEDLLRALSPELDPDTIGAYGEGSEDAKVLSPDAEVRAVLRVLPAQTMVVRLDETLLSHPEWAFAWAWRGMLRRRLLQYSGAIDDFDRAWELGLRTAALLTWRGEARLKVRDFDRGLADMRAALERPDALAWNHAWAGRTLITLKRDAEGLRMLDRAVELSPSTGWYQAWRGLGKCRLGAFDGMLADFDTALDLLKDPKSRALTYCWRGLGRYETGDAARGLKDLDRGLRVMKRYAVAYFWRANVSRRLGRLKNWIDDIDRAANLDDKYFNNVPSGGMGLETKSLSADLDKLLDKSPRAAKARFWRGLVRATSGRGPEAVADFDAAERLGLRRALLYARRGESLLDAGNPKRALRDLSRALRADPKNVAALVGLGRARLALGDRDAARRTLRESLGRDPHSERVLAARAEAWLTLDDKAAAIADLRDAVTRNPNRADTRADLGLALGRGGDADGEKRELELAVRLNPEAAMSRARLWAERWGETSDAHRRLLDAPPPR